MNIGKIVEEKYQGKCSQYRLIRGDAQKGVLATGFVKKNTKQGSLYNLKRDQYDILLILSGEGIYRDEKMGDVPIGPGDCVQRLPGLNHSTIIGTNDWREVYLCMGREIFAALSSAKVFNDQKPVLHTGLDFELIQLFIEIHNQMESCDRDELPLIIPKAIGLVTRATYLDRLHEIESDEVNTLKLSTAYIKENVHQRLSVEDVAAYVNMGYEKYRKLFLNHYGISPGNYILNQRIREAQNLLANHDLSIKEIALLLGYTDAYTFSKQFKKNTGHTPSRFRALYH